MSAEIIVIGAGHNGLTAAGLLAKAGKRVLVLEQAEVAGGVGAGAEFHPGYRGTGLLHDTTAVRKAVIEELSLHSHGLSLRGSEPPVFSPALEGKGVLVSSGREELPDDHGLSDWDVEYTAAFREFLGRVGAALSPVLNAPPPDVFATGVGDLLSMLKTGLSLRKLGRTDLLEFLRMGPMCIADVLNEWFESPILKAQMAAPAVRGSFTGPWSPGTALFLLLQTASKEHAGVQGGPAGLTAALLSAAKANGAEVRTGSRVQQILVSRGRATGVSLTTGETFGAETILSTCDPKQTILKFISKLDIPLAFRNDIRNVRMRGTTAKMWLALNGPLEFSSRPGRTFERIRIGEELDDLERSFDGAKYGALPQVPHLDIWVPSVSDPTLAPSGHHVASLLVHFVPYHLEGGWNDGARTKLEENVLSTLGRYVPDLKKKIVAKETLTPVDLEARYGLTEGHVDQGEPALDQLLFMRPCQSCSHYATPVERLYLGGSGSHPGGGMTCAPGRFAARAILGKK